MPTTLTSSLLEACMRCLGKIDVLVGNVKANVDAALRLDANQNLHEKLRGKVLVVEAVAPEVVMRSVAKQRLAGAIQEAVLLPPRDIDHAWLAALGEGPWSCCFPREPGSPVVAHIGGHRRGFVLVFARLGVVLDVYSEMSGDPRDGVYGGATRIDGCVLHDKNLGTGLDRAPGLWEARLHE